MSFHVTKPEIHKAIRKQRMRQAVSSTLIAFLVLTLILLFLSFLFLAHKREAPTLIVAYSYFEPQVNPDPMVLKETIKKKPSAPRSSVTQIITTDAVSEVSIPIPEIELKIPLENFGIEEGFGNFGGKWGGSVDRSEFDSVPANLRSRCSPQERMQRLKEMGGTEECERAVIKALDWLKQTQNEDGSWTGDEGTAMYPVAMTGLAILAYLGHCETPQSIEYGETVEKGIVYLINASMQGNDADLITSPGMLSNASSYEHGIATYALAEAYTMCKAIEYEIPNLKGATKKGGMRILYGQSPSGTYTYKLCSETPGGDNSIGYWQLQALKALKHTEIVHHSKFRRHIKQAMSWLRNVQGMNGAIGYREQSTISPGLTGGGLLCMQFWDEGGSDNAKRAIEYVRNNTAFVSLNDPSGNLYYHYYIAQAMINVGGRDWEWHNDLFRDKLLEAQQPNGTWDQNMHHGALGTHMATCLATLMLEVYYRYLPGTGTS